MTGLTGPTAGQMLQACEVVWHGWKLLAHSCSETVLCTPLQVLVHVAGRVITPLPQLLEHWLNWPRLHTYVGQHGSGGHGRFELAQVPVQNDAATGVPAGTPGVVSVHWHTLEREPAVPHVWVVHEPTTLHEHE